MDLAMSQEYLYTKVGDKEAFRLIREAGFDAVDYSFYYMIKDEHILNTDQAEEYIRDLKAYADRIGLAIHQTHAPFPIYREGGDPAVNAKMPDRVKRSIRYAAMLGATHIVVHIVSPCPAGEDEFAYNLAMLRELEPVAAESGIKLAIENAFGYDPKRDRIIPMGCSYPEDIHRYLDALGDENFITCFDTGHCAVVGSEPELCIRALGGKRLRALHIHDNDYKGDTHRLPYTGGTEWNSNSINWDAVTQALRDIGYQGDFTFETDESVLRGFDKELYPTVLRFMHDVGRFLMKKINQI